MVLWLVLLVNTAMLVGVMTYGLGRVPFRYSEVLRWFGLGALLAAVGLAFARLCATDVRGEMSSLEDASPRVVRLILGVVGFGVMATGALVMGVISTVSLLGR
jgi:hypothetical protein